MRTGQPPEVKETPVLRPPGQVGDSAGGPGANLRWLWMPLSALLILTLAVVFGLPRVVAPVAETEIAASSPVPSDESEAQRDAANQALQRYLGLRAELALDNADAWGEPDWSEAADLASTADRYFAERRFALAARDYQAALGRLQQLDAGRADMLAEALEDLSRFSNVVPAGTLTLPKAFRDRAKPLGLSMTTTTVHDNYFMFVKCNYQVPGSVIDRTDMAKAELEVRRRMARAAGYPSTTIGVAPAATGASRSVWAAMVLKARMFSPGATCPESALKITNIPIRKPKSPIRLTMNAFLPATELAMSWYQNPISR